MSGKRQNRFKLVLAALLLLISISLAECVIEQNTLRPPAKNRMIVGYGQGDYSYGFGPWNEEECGCDVNRAITASEEEIAQYLEIDGKELMIKTN